MRSSKAADQPPAHIRFDSEDEDDADKIRNNLNSDLKSEHCKTRGNESCMKNEAKFPTLKILAYERRVSGFRMYQSLEFVQLRFEREDKKIFFILLGCCHPRHKSFKGAIRKSLKHIIKTGCSKAEATEWISRLPALKKWISLTGKVIKEVYSTADYPEIIRLPG